MNRKKVLISLEQHNTVKNRCLSRDSSVHALITCNNSASTVVHRAPFIGEGAGDVAALFRRCCCKLLLLLYAAGACALTAPLLHWCSVITRIYIYIYIYTKVQSGSDKSPSSSTPASTTTLPGTGMPPPIISSTPPVGGKFAKKINEIIDLHPVDSDRSGTPSASKVVNVGAAGSKRPGSPTVNPVPKRLTSASRHLLCSHNVRKTRCKLCNGASLCRHQRQKLHCKDCGEGSDSPARYWIFSQYNGFVLGNLRGFSSHYRKNHK